MTDLAACLILELVAISATFGAIPIPASPPDEEALARKTDTSDRKHWGKCRHFFGIARGMSWHRCVSRSRRSIGVLK